MAVEYVISLKTKKVGTKVISKHKKPEKFGVNTEIPEGIFGIVDTPKKKKKKKKREPEQVLSDIYKPSKKKLAEQAEKPKTKAKTVEPVIIGAAPAAPPAPLPDAQKKKKKGTKDKVKIKTTEEDIAKVGVPKKADKPKKKKKKAKLTVEPIKPPKPVPKRTPGVMPQLEINYASMMPREAEGLALQNVVSIPESLLKSVARKTERRTKDLSQLLLTNSAPSLLSYDAASNYVKTVLADGLKIDVDIDRGVLEVVKELARLDVVFFYLKRLSLPRSLKKRYMQRFIDELSKASLETMQKTNKSDAISSQLRELEGVLVKHSEHQAKQGAVRTHNAKDKRIGMTTDGARATKRTRTDSAKPMAGGF
jgi:hypothetical protein